VLVSLLHRLSAVGGSVRRRLGRQPSGLVRRADPAAPSRQKLRARLVRHLEKQMEKQAFLHDFQQRIADLIRSSPAADLERNLKAMMGQTFQRLELVTREEFDIQVELVDRLRARVEAIERQLASERDSKH
jgi:ubiquinone biosynthesis accessory factor UbiK